MFTTHKTYTAYAVAPAVMVMIVLSAVAKLFGNCLCIPDLAKPTTAAVAAPQAN